MRLGRIMLALSALAAAMVTSFETGSVSRPASANSHPRLLHPVVSFLLSAAEDTATAAPSQRPAPRAALSLEALSVTPLRSSLYLVASVVAVNFFLRRHQRTQLRC